MNRIPVQSSHVAEVGYDDATMTLEVLFHDGGLYQYFDVPQMVYEELMRAESVGRSLHANIRNAYRYVQL